MAFRPKRTSSVPEPSTHPLTFVMGVQFLTFFAIVLTLGSRWLPRSQALLRPQICTRSSVQCRGCTSLLERDVGGSCSMSSSPLTRSGPGSIILGSKSFTRKMIVEEMGFAPIIRSAGIDEAAIGDRTSDPADLVLQLGIAKAEALLPGLKAEAARGILGATMLLTGDQVVVHEGRILEKPADEDEVRKNVAGYARSPCRTVGSAVLTHVLTGRQVSGVDTAEISFSEIPDTVVTQLCKEGTVLQCAGGLMIEHTLVQPYILKIDGTIDSIMGLSKPLLLSLLGRLESGSG